MTPLRLRLALAAAFVLAIGVGAYFWFAEDAPPVLPAPGISADAAPAPTAPGTAASPGAERVAQPAAPADTAPPVVAGKSATPLIRTPEGRIAPSSLADFQPMPFPGGEPAYEGEKVTAYIAVPSSSRKVALSVNQLGEFPRIDTTASEQVEVRLSFSSTQPGGRVAVVAQDGGRLHTGKLSAALPVDDARQIAFAFIVSPNVGTHRVSITTPTGEVKTLEFWAGPPPVLMRSAGR